MIFGKVRADRFTRPQRKIDVRYQFIFMVIWKGLLCKQRLIFQAASKSVIVSAKLILPKVGDDRLTGPQQKSFAI